MQDSARCGMLICGCLKTISDWLSALIAETGCMASIRCLGTNNIPCSINIVSSHRCVMFLAVSCVPPLMRGYNCL
jgi:hypothetical protein